MRVPFVLTAIPVVAASVVGSLAAVWGVSRLAGFRFDPSVVAAFSAVLAGVAVARARGPRG
jgi:hypothetical protein